MTVPLILCTDIVTDINETNIVTNNDTNIDVWVEANSLR